mmetsp:Transcript_25462/g.73556  ORF Transcript_25462/g.73556 Transcript_25462/m.73556 type:complete len:158 (-) Transcript_25462:1322-1795(-)
MDSSDKRSRALLLLYAHTHGRPADPASRRIYYTHARLINHHDHELAFTTAAQYACSTEKHRPEGTHTHTHTEDAPHTHPDASRPYANSRRAPHIHSRPPTSYERDQISQSVHCTKHMTSDHKTRLRPQERLPSVSRWKFSSRHSLRALMAASPFLST